MSYISKLRKRPKHVRDNIAFVAAGVATLPVIAYLVFVVHGPKMTNLAESEAKTPKFFETLTNQIKEQVATVREATSTTSPAVGKYPATVDRGPLDAVPVVPEGSESRLVSIATTSTSTSSTSLESAH